MEKKILDTSKKINNLISSKQKKIVGLCHGAFDLIHIGHINHLNEAKKHCDILIVSITADKYIKKGPHQPFYNHNLRAKFLSNLSMVDYVYISHSYFGLDPIQKFKPDFYIKGIDYKQSKNDLSGQIIKEISFLKKNNGKIIYTNSQKLSSTKILNENFDLFSNQQKKYIKLIKKKYSKEEIIKEIEKLKNVKVVLVGEPIVDQHIFVESIGTATKSPVVSSIYKHKEKHLGGSLAVANSLAEFSNKITYLLPKNYKSQINKCNSKLNKNIKIKKINNAISFSTKTRFLNQTRNHKLFQINNTNLKQFNKKFRATLIREINKSKKKKYELFLIDYGLGFFDNQVASKKLLLNNSYLNVQTNSENIGYNLFSKYKNYKYLSINKRELELNFSNKIEDKKIINFLKITKTKVPISITLGEKGSLYVDKKYKSFLCPNFINNALDTNGCGDTYYALTSLLVKANIDSILIPFLGNCYAGLHSKILGNKHIPKKNDLIKLVNSII